MALFLHTSMWFHKGIPLSLYLAAFPSKDGYENTIHDHEERENEKEHGNEERCELFDNPHQETPVYKIRFEMIKYSFGQDEEYVAIKECEYDDLTKTNVDACRAY
ncbi:hypothetical protein Tco_0367520 [Tanacetum coccineum]